MEQGGKRMKQGLAKSLHLIKNDFVRSVTVLMSGTMLSQMAIILVTPILTRIYGPEEFGVYAVYTAILYTVSIIASLHYETAIPLPKEDSDSINIMVVALIILCGTILFISLCMILFLQPLIDLFRIQNFATYLYGLPLSILGLGMFQVFQLWALRQEKYSNIAKGRVRMNITQISSQVGLGIISNTGGFLIAGEVLGRMIGGLGLAYSFKKDILTSINHISWKKIKSMAIRYKNFPLISSWSSVLEGLSNHIPTFFIAGTLGVKAAGWYLIAGRILALPEAILGYSVKQVYLAKAAKLLHQSFSEFLMLFWTTVKKLILIACIVFTFISILSPSVFPIVFGNEWKEAGTYVLCMCVLYFIQFIVVPISTNFYLLELLHMQIFVEAGRLILLLAGILYANYFLTEAWQIILCMSIAGSFGSLLVGIASWYSTSYYRKKLTL